MKLSNVIEMATQGEWKAKCVKTSIGRCWKINSATHLDDDYGATCLYDSDTSLNPKSSEEIKANAALIVHEHKHFPKLLERLKAFQRQAEIDLDMTLGDYYDSMSGRFLNNAIAAAEEVEGV